MSFVCSTISMYDSLMDKYSEYLKEEIVEITMIQTKQEVLLEIIEAEILEDGLEKQTVSRIDLEFIRVDENGEMIFKPEEPVEVNTRKFINEFSPYSIISTTDLFHEKACELISKRYNIFGVDK